MTATQTHPKNGATKPAAGLDELAQRVDEAVRAAYQHHFDTFRAMANEAQITARSVDLDAALAGITEAQAAKRDADEQERVEKEAYAAATVEAEWELTANCFEVRSNKTWGVVNPETGESIPEADQRSYTADEKKAWLAYQVARYPAVKGAASNLRQAEFDAVVAADAIKVADKRFTAARLQFEGAVARLNALSGVIKESA